MGIGWARWAENARFIAAAALTPATPASVAFLASAVDATDLTIYTFSDVPFGAEHAQRKIVVGVGTRANTPRTISSVTIGGVTASVIGSVISGGSGNNLTAMYQATVPTGASGDIVVTFSGVLQRCGISAYRVLGEIDSFDTSAADAPTATLDIPNNGAAIGYAFSTHQTVPVTATWSNIAEDADEAIEGSNAHSSASAEFETGGSKVLTCTWSTSPPTFGTGGVFLSIGPFSGPADAVLVGEFGELLPAYFGNAEWTSTEKLRYAPPVLVNPIEPGTERDETKPGTGIKTIIPTSFHSWTIPENQDVLIVGSEHVAAGTRTGQLQLFNDDGRRIVVRGFESSNQRFLIDNSGTFYLEGFRCDKGATLDIAVPDALYVFARPGSINTFQNCHTKRTGGTAKQFYVGTTPFTHNSAAITSISKAGGVITLTLAEEPPEELTTGRECIVNGSAFGGSDTSPSDNFNFNWQVGTVISPTSCTLVKIKDNTVPADGTSATGGTFWQLQTTNGLHGDGMQVLWFDAAGAQIRLDKCSFGTMFQGFYAQGIDANYKLSRVNCYRDLTTPFPWDYFTFLFDAVGGLEDDEYTCELYQTWAESHPLHGVPRDLETSMLPLGATGVMIDGQRAVSFADFSQITGVMYQGLPEQDFAPWGDLGVDYTSPGYGDTRAPQTGDITAITDDIPAEVDDALADNGHIAWIDATFSSDLVNAIIDIHISAGDTDRFKLTGRELVRAGTALEADTEYLLTLTATIRDTAISIERQVSVQTSA